MVWGLNTGGVSFPHLSRPALVPKEPPVQWVPEGRWPGHGVAHALATQSRG